MADKTILMLLSCDRKRSCKNIRKIIGLNITNARAHSIVLLAAIGNPARPSLGLQTIASGCRRTPREPSLPLLWRADRGWQSRGRPFGKDEKVDG